jgi:hypothetical protein
MLNFNENKVTITIFIPIKVILILLCRYIDFYTLLPNYLSMGSGAALFS